MNDIMTADKVKTLMQPLIDKGCFFEYFYEKGGDSSCVYICRFKKGKDFFDWREVSGANEIHLVVSVNGEYRFPDLEKRHPKTVRTFKRKHLFKKATLSDRRDLFAELLLEELRSSPADFFGISL